MAHKQVRTCGEPWLALPFALMFRRDVCFATYGNASLIRSGENFLQHLPGGEEAFLREAGKCIERLYSKMSEQDNECFIDKTPRYYKIVPELVKMFPDAKFIILKREPVSVFASIINYIEEKLHLLPTWEQDITEGIPLLADAIGLLEEKSLVIDYENLVGDTQSVVANVFEFMDLPAVEAEELEGCLAKNHITRGDPTGMKKYDKITDVTLTEWSRRINTFTRRRVALKWFSRVEHSAFERLGYDRMESLRMLKNCSAKFDVLDEFCWLLGCLYFNLQFNVMRWGWRRRRKGMSKSIY